MREERQKGCKRRDRERETKWKHRTQKKQLQRYENKRRKQV
jgi:hypothetical protein